MKYLCGSARNLFLAVDDEGKEVIPSVECIILVAEQQYRPTLGRSWAKKPTIKALRFCADTAVLRNLSRMLTDWANEADQLVTAQKAGQPEPPEQPEQPRAPEPPTPILFTCPRAAVGKAQKEEIGP